MDLGRQVRANDGDPKTRDDKEKEVRLTSIQFHPCPLLASCHDEFTTLPFTDDMAHNPASTMPYAVDRPAYQGLVGYGAEA